MSERSVVAERQVESSHLAFLHNAWLYTPALLDKGDLQKLQEAGLIDKEATFAEHEEKTKHAEMDRFPLSINDYLDRCSGFKEKRKDKKILTRQWMVTNPEEFDKGYKDWIVSTHERFCEMIAYEPFYLYVLQWQQWLKEGKFREDFEDEYEREVFTRTEWARMAKHTAYFADKYAKINEPGEPQFVSTLCHLFLFFLFDQLRSVFGLKPRQIAWTTFIGICGCKTLITQMSSNQVFIAHDKDSGVGILDKKVKFVFEHLPDWMKLPVINTPDGLFKVSYDLDGGRSSKKARSASIETRTPKIDAINSRSPDIVYIDEAPFIGEFDKMWFEARPTMKGRDHKTGLMKVKRRVWSGGTGGRVETGKGAYEREFKGELDKFAQGRHESGITPIFLDWTTRPSATIEEYRKEEAAYAAGSKEGHTHMSVQERMIQFRQHWPSSVDDAFNASKATLVPYEYLMEQKDRIDKWYARGASVQYGEFEPVWGDVVMPTGSPLPRNIIGVRWKPAMEGDRLAPVAIWQHPERWVDRYWQGTDPIQSDAGQSRMASAIFDSLFGTISAMLCHRSNDPHDSYLQCALLGMYYAPKGEMFVKELIEQNIAGRYIDFKCGAWLDPTKRSLVHGLMLPDLVRPGQQGPNKPGIVNSGGTKKHIVSYGKDFLITNYKKIFIPGLISELRHFVGTPTKGIEGTRWGTEDKDKYQDDQVDAAFFSYICRLCYPGRMPVELEVYQKQVSAPRRRLYRYGPNRQYHGWTDQPVTVL